LNEASPHGDLWRAMRQAGSSFAIATRISARVIEDLPPSRPTDGGGLFAVDMPRAEMLQLLDDAASERPGLPNYIHVNGVDLLIVAAYKDFAANAAWLETAVLGRPLSARERRRSALIAALIPPVSLDYGADAKFGLSGTIPYYYSSQEAFGTVSFLMPRSCFLEPKMKALLAAEPDHRDNTTDLGCYLQVTTTYQADIAAVDYCCAYDSPFYLARQKALNQAVLALCPATQRYVNTPSAFLTARDYFPNYDELAAIKAHYDPDETFRIYQGVRPTGLAPDAYEWRREYTRTRSAADIANELAWDAVRRAW